MPDRRQVHRREPIVVVVMDETEFEALPLPWLARNDMGNEILSQSAELTNESLRLYVDPDSQAPQLEMKLNEKLSDPIKILLMAYPGKKRADFERLNVWEVTELILASLDANQLENVKPLVDPNYQPPEKNSGKSSSGAEVLDSLKTLSSPGSSSPDSSEVLSSS